MAYFSATEVHSATGAGTAYLDGSAVHTWQFVVTGSPTSLTIKLEGSIDDGANWFTLDSSSNTSGEMRHVVNRFVTQIRSNLTALAGGSAPTVAVTWISEPVHEGFSRHKINDAA